MKSVTRIALLALILSLMASPAAADWMSIRTSDGQVHQILVAKVTTDGAASGIAVSGAAAFYGIVVVTDGTNNITLNVYDNTAAAGSTLVPADTVILGGDRIWTFSWDPAIKCTTGIYVSISVAGGGTAKWKVQYDQ
ncbi:MAG: hypothetical protein LLG97_19635 [Deltaproteobacteria bacterium]|nr:hypothetical protein [Deltaproteobacteria bacterium]